jgi:hypothetical protein
VEQEHETMATSTYEQVLHAAQQLTREEQRRLREELAASEPAQKSGSSYGILKHLGQAPSAEDIDDVRREMWAGFTDDEAA